MSKLTIVKKEDGFYLSIEGTKSALINLGEHGPIVNAAIAGAVSSGTPRCQVLGCMNDGVYAICEYHARDSRSSHTRHD